MENNRFYQHRKEIETLAEKNQVTFDIANRMFAKEKGWSNYTVELNEWEAYVRKFQRAKDNAKGMDKNGDGHVNVADAFV